jgi:hypothetical protein
MSELVNMLEEQLALQKRLGYDYANMTRWERIAYIKNMYIAAVQELGEALNEVSWKPWTTGEIKIDELAFIGELNDTWQFVANMWFAVMPSATPAEIAHAMEQTHHRKIGVNLARVKMGYDGTNKCSACKRALDDPHVACTTTVCHAGAANQSA